MELSTIVAEMNAVVLERITAESFVRVSEAPTWWRDRVGDDRPEPEALVLRDVFPFLAVFLPQAERAWSSATYLPVASELWTEPMPGGRDIHLEAFAKRVGDTPVLVIVRNDQAFHERQLLVQRARELRVTYDKLMREMERKDILLHTIVHDLTAPLHSIVGALSLLGETELPAAAARWTEIATAAAARQRELIQSILSVFVTEHGGASESSPVDVSAALTRAIAEREPVARQRRIQLDAEAWTETWVGADEMRLVRVLTNLLDNAIRHSPAGSLVRIAQETELASLRVVVEDHGAGVAPDVVPRLFQKLARDPRGGGSGLGLYFCRITVEQWGGGIGYEPTPGGGARFWIRLPLARPTNGHHQRRSDNGQATLAR